MMTWLFKSDIHRLKSKIARQMSKAFLENLPTWHKQPEHMYEHVLEWSTCVHFGKSGVLGNRRVTPGRRWLIRSAWVTEGQGDWVEFSGYKYVFILIWITRACLSRLFLSRLSSPLSLLLCSYFAFFFSLPPQPVPYPSLPPPLP